MGSILACPATKTLQGKKVIVTDSTSRIAGRRSQRFKKLGVAEDAPSSLAFLRDAPAKRPSAIRVMQWNILAEGLSHDGFFVQRVLPGPPEKPSFADQVQETVAKRRACDGQDKAQLKASMAPLKERFSSPSSQANHDAVVDWGARWAGILHHVEALCPDVVCFQELDHMKEAQADMGKLGYACGLPSKKYAPYHAVAESTSYMDFANASGIAFAAKHDSHARRLGLKAGRASADNDGCAIFWRKDVFALDYVPLLDYLPIHRGASTEATEGAVRVGLKRKADGQRVHVICAHFLSGSAPAAEADRVGHLPGLQAWLDASLEAADVAVMCCDTNSQPTRTEAETVWKTLRGSGSAVRSVWDAEFDPDTGAPRVNKPPVTTNKMRGPLTEQSGKIGEHTYGVVDHIFFGGATVARFVLKPTHFDTAAGALSHMLPNLTCPSDHYPVVVDFALPVVEAVHREDERAIAGRTAMPGAATAVVGLETVVVPFEANSARA